MVPAAIERTNVIVQPALRAVVANLEGRPREAAEYHLGWTDANGDAVHRGGGKGIRPALTLLGAEAVGAQIESALPAAVAVELIHNFSLIHDDIVDGDKTRRHRPTVWALWGIGDAIVAGEAMQSLAFEHLLSMDSPHTLAATRCLADATGAMIAGQAQDIALDQADTATLAQCLEMEANKTGALLACASSIGAIAAGANDAAVTALDSYGRHLGLSFQAVDDVLGIWGDPQVTGKAAGNDLRETKKSMPVALALEAGGSLADQIRTAFAGDVDDATVSRLASALHDAGFHDDVLDLARSHLDQALHALDGFAFATGPHEELVQVARFVIERNF